MDKVPEKVPADVEAEWSVLSLVLVDPARFREIAGYEGEFFYDPVLRNIFLAMQRIYKKGKNVSLPLVKDVLSEKGLLNADIENMLTNMYLRYTLADVPVLWEGFVEKLRSAYRKRLLLKYADELREIAEKPVTVMAEEVVTEAKKRFDKYLTKLEDVGIDVLGPEELIEILKEEERKICEGCSDVVLSSLFDGFEEGELLVVAARPGVGKTTMMLIDAFEIAKEYPVLFVSREMTAWELMKRLDMYTRGRAATELANREFHITTAASTPEQIEMAAKKVGAKFVFVDYLQRLHLDGYFRTREEEIAYISRKLKDMAMDMRVVIIAAAQLNRDLERRENREPRLSDLRGSGQIEQDSNQVLMLWREEMDDVTPVEILWKIAKNRRGPMKRGRLAFLPKEMRFYFLERVE